MTIATILPPARTVFVDENNIPISGGQVFMYVPNTITLKTTWQDAAGSIPNSNPIVLDGDGSCLLYGSGQYEQQVFDSLGNLIYTGLTQDVYALIVNGNNTFTGTNVLSSTTSGTTQVFGDSTTAVATDAFVARAIPQVSRVSAQFNKTSDAGLANVTGLTANVAAGATYYFRAHLLLTCNASGGIQLAISGTATSTTFAAEATSYDGTTIKASATSTTYNSAIIGTTSVNSIAWIEGSIVVNAGGTLTVQFAQNVSFGTASSVLVGSTFSVQRIA